jgi:hypothetical protein
MKQTEINIFRVLELIITEICINVIVLEQINILNVINMVRVINQIFRATSFSGNAMIQVCQDICCTNNILQSFDHSQLLSFWLHYSPPSSISPCMWVMKQLCLPTIPPPPQYPSVIFLFSA